MRKASLKIATFYEILGEISVNLTVILEICVKFSPSFPICLEISIKMLIVDFTFQNTIPGLGYLHRIFEKFV